MCRWQLLSIRRIDMLECDQRKLALLVDARAGLCSVEARVAAHTILIVDDEPMTLEVLVELFSDAGYNTLSATHGAHAIVLLETTQPDLILTDLVMPIMDGIELCRVVSANPQTSTIPIVVLSALSDLRERIDVPIAGFFSKPIEFNRLLSHVSALLP
jgi:two-component system, cell cycle response regulator